MNQYVKNILPEPVKSVYRDGRYFLRRKLDRLYLLSENQDRLLKRVASEAESFVSIHGVKKTRRVLIPTSYLNIQLTRVTDFVLTIALKIRGAEIVPVVCNGFHKEQCPVFAGAFIREWLNDFPRQCRQYCNDPGHILWENVLGYKPLHLSNFGNESDYLAAEKLVEGIDHSNFMRYDFEGFPAGVQAAEVVANNNNLGRVLPGEPFATELRIHAANAVRMVLAYRKVLDYCRPDVAVGTYHDHYQWSSLYHVLGDAGLAYYSYMMIDKKDSLYFGRNVEKDCEVDGAWPTFRESTTDDDVWKRFESAMERKADGGATHFDLYPRRGSNEFRDLQTRLDPRKPVVFFPVNVPWDNAIHHHCFVARDIIDLVVRTVRFFNAHPEYQLVIKSHPMERNFRHFSFLPHTLKRILDEVGEPLGQNILHIDADSPISSFDLYPVTDLGIVHSSRSGIELALYGVPVILTTENNYRGKGFTIDVSSEGEFYESIVRAVTSQETEETKQHRIVLAKKYWLLYNYHAFIQLGLFREGWTKPVELGFNSLDDFMPGRNSKLDYICDSVMSGKPVFADNRWPPVSL